MTRPSKISHLVTGLSTASVVAEPGSEASLVGEKRVRKPLVRFFHSTADKVPIAGSLRSDPHQHRAVREGAPHLVLHVGSGAAGQHRLYPMFRTQAWQQTRVDIDQHVRPDIVASITDMKGKVPDGGFDALWCSHTLEHLDAHEVLPALSEFRRVLKPTGFALVRTPDIEAVAEILLRIGADSIVYKSPAGDITALDMIYGHGLSIARGNGFMRHNTGFTAERIGTLLVDAGFAEVRTLRAPNLEVWAVAFGASAPVSEILRDLRTHGTDFLIETE